MKTGILKLFHNSAEIIWIILFAVVLYLPEFVSRELWEPDEARYAYVAKEMKTNNNWLIPHRNSIPYSHKPPLMFWLINIFSIPFKGDINRISSRLPSILGFIMSLYSTAKLANNLYSPSIRWLSCGILSTMFLFTKTSGFGQIDSLLTGLITMCISMAKTFELNRKLIYIFLSSFFSSLAILAKGPVGLLIPVGVIILDVLVAKNYRMISINWLWGLLIAISPVCLWLLAVYLFSKDHNYLREVIFIQNISRARGEFGHLAPFYYYVWHILFETIPWTPLAVVAVFLTVKSKNKDNASVFLLCWICFVIIFFSILPTKRNIYILSAYPPLAILTANVLLNRKDSIIRMCIKIVITIVVICGITEIIISILNFLEVLIPNINLLFLALTGTILLITSGLCMASLQSNKTYIKPAGIIIAGLIFHYITFSATIYPELNRLKTPYPLKLASLVFASENNEILLYKTHGEILALYAGKTGKEFWSDKELIKFLKNKRSAFIACNYERWDEISQKLEGKLIWGCFNMGNKKIVWCKIHR